MKKLVLVLAILFPMLILASPALAAETEGLVKQDGNYFGWYFKTSSFFGGEKEAFPIWPNKAKIIVGPGEVIAQKRGGPTVFATCFHYDYRLPDDAPARVRVSLRNFGFGDYILVSEFLLCREIGATIIGGNGDQNLIIKLIRFEGKFPYAKAVLEISVTK